MRNILSFINYITEKNNPGFYSCVTPSKHSLEILNKFTMKFFDIQVPYDVHCTVMYSMKSISDSSKAQKYSRSFYEAYANRVEYWSGHDNTGYLVLKIDSEDLQDEHRRLKELGAKPTFDDYQSHITLANPIDNTDDLQFKIKVANKYLESHLIDLKLGDQKTDILRL